MSERKYKIESMNTNGPCVEELDTDQTLYKLNNEKKNKRMIFVDGKPVMNEIITEDDIKNCKKTITVVNELIGG